MMDSVGEKNLTVALVYPPYSPDAVPSLGLALLSAGIKGMGFDCTTFYWNLHFQKALRIAGLSYSAISRELSFPANEWLFARHVFDDDRACSLDRMIREQRTAFQGWWKKPPKADRDLGARVGALLDRADASLDELLGRLAPFDIIGISSTFYSNMPALAVARQIKRRFPGKIVVLGGANCEDEMGPALLEQFAFLDCVFSGEVDFSFPEFVRRVQRREGWDDIPGIAYRDGDCIVLGPRAAPLTEMDRLPIPDYDDYMAERERAGMENVAALALESSRGCWWGAKQHCTFCGLNALGMSYRQKSADRFREEVETLVNRYGTRYIYTTDNIISMDYFKDFMQWASGAQLQVQFFYETKANLKREQVELMVDAGITRIQPGIESFSSNILRLMRKGVSGPQNVALLKYITENDMLVVYTILAGFPGEDPADYELMEKGLANLVHLPPPNNIGIIRFQRFSPYHQDPGSFGISLRPSDKYAYLYPFPAEVISRIAYQFQREDPPELAYLKPLRERLARWQRAYYTRLVLLGDGCSLFRRNEGADDLVIHDQRSWLRPTRYRVRGYAARVLNAMDRPTTIEGILRRSGESVIVREASPSAARHPGIVDAAAEHRWLSVAQALLSLVHAGWYALRRKTRYIEFGREEFKEDPGTCLDVFRQAGLVHVEGDTYVALPVAPKRRRVHSLWPNQIDRVPLAVLLRMVGRLASAYITASLGWRSRKNVAAIGP